MFGFKEDPSRDRLHPVNFGLAWGLSFGIYFLFIFLVAWLTGWGKPLTVLVGSWYPAAGPTFLGSLFAGAWAFIDGFIGGWLIAVFYNFFQGRKK